MSANDLCILTRVPFTIHRAVRLSPGLFSTSLNRAFIPTRAHRSQDGLVDLAIPNTQIYGYVYWFYVVIFVFPHSFLGSWVIGLTLPYEEYVAIGCTYVSILCSESYYVVYVQYGYNNPIV